MRRVLHLVQARLEAPRVVRAQLPEVLAESGAQVQRPVAALGAAAAELRAPAAAVQRQGERAVRGVAQAEQLQEELRAAVLHVAVREPDVGRPGARLQVAPPLVALSAEPWALLWALPCARLQAQAQRPVPG